MATALLVAYTLAVVAAAVATALKGKWGVLAVGFLAGFAWWFGAVRLAKPRSWWARRFYDEEKAGRAAARHSSSRYRAVAAGALALNALLVVALFAGTKAYRIPGSSMEPTLRCAEPGIGCSAAESDRILALRSAFGGEARRGDVVAYRTPEAASACGFFDPAGATYLHRVVALAGETVGGRSGRIVVDGTPLDEPYADLGDDGLDFSEEQVPADHVFVVGDNRAQSCDSRVFGPVPEENVVARVVFRYWPLDRLGTL